MLDASTGERRRAGALPDGWQQRGFREGDEEGLFEMIAAAFGRWPGIDTDVPPIEHYRWKLLSRGATRWHQLVTVDGRIVGARPFIPQRIKVKERIVDAVQPVDTAVHPDFRNQRVMKVLRQVEEEQLAESTDLRFNIRSAHVAISRLRQKYAGATVQFGNRTDVLTCHLGLLAESSSFTRRLARGLILSAQRLAYSLLEGRPGDGPWTLRTVPKFDERVDLLWREAAQQFDFIVERTHDYLNWRYADPRAGRFTIRAAEEDGRLLGYSVLSVSGGRGHIADLLALPDRLDVVRSLVRDALACFRGHRVSAVDCWVQAHHPYRETLRRQGFLHKKRSIALGGLMLSSPHDMDFASSRRAAVHVTAGDTDLV